MKRILAVFVLLFIVGCAVPEETQPAADSSKEADPIVDKVGSDTEENAVLAEELADDLDDVVAGLEGIDW